MAHKKLKTFSSGSVSDMLKHRKGFTENEKKLEAIFLMEEIASVDVDRAFQEVGKKIDRHNKTRRLFTKLTRVAAILTVPLLVFSIWQLSVRNKTQRITEYYDSWQEIQNPSGIRSKVSLPDGSFLWLNAESIIGYPIPFVGENRQVELSGEAYFDVKKNQKNPFTVKAADAKIRVLGTQFNVKAYPEEKQIEVALKEGRVEFVSLNRSSDEVHTDMNPNDYLLFDKSENQINIENKNIDPYISWHQDMLIFNDTPMSDWSRIIERWYGVKIEILDEEIMNYHFNGTIEDETVRDVMQILELTLNVSCRIDHKNITIEKSGK
jgi:ferric-dicitrate binding protein FerR (iron transport regulator)